MLDFNRLAVQLGERGRQPLRTAPTDAKEHHYGAHASSVTTEAFWLQPHRRGRWKLSNERLFVDEVRDTAGSPP
jgi:hypothetical protein